MQRNFGRFHRLLRQRLFWLGIITIALTLTLAGVSSPAANGFTLDSHEPPPTATPVPTQPPPTATFAPTQPAPTATPIPPNTPAATATTVATATLTPIAGGPSASPAPTLPPPPPTQAAPVAPPPELTPPVVISPSPAPSQPITDTVPASESDNLIKLIDTFVRYSFYFLLGLGVISFLILIIVLYYLYRRSQALSREQEPPDNL